MNSDHDASPIVSTPSPLSTRQRPIEKRAKMTPKTPPSPKIIRPKSSTLFKRVLNRVRYISEDEPKTLTPAEQQAAIAALQAKKASLQASFWTTNQTLAGAAKNYALEACLYTTKIVPECYEKCHRRKSLRGVEWFDEWEMTEECREALRPVVAEEKKAAEILAELGGVIFTMSLTAEQWCLYDVFTAVSGFLDAEESDEVLFKRLCSALHGYFTGRWDCWLDFAGEMGESSGEGAEAHGRSVHFDEEQLASFEGVSAPVDRNTGRDVWGAVESADGPWIG